MNFRTLSVVVLSIAVLSALSALSLFGQNGQIAGPAIGFVFDSSVSALRPVLGIPGASTMGNPVNAGFALSWATVAPRQDSAIATAADGSLHLLRLSSGVAETPCAACPATAQAAIFSPAGTSVALYSAGRAQIVTGLPGAPVAGASFEVGALPRALRGRAMPPPMAISDDGAWLLAATSASVTLFNANGGSRQLLGTGPYPQVAFAAGSHDAAIADGYVAGLVLFHDVAGASTPQSLDTPDDIRHSGAVAFSTDGGKLFVAVPEQQSVAVSYTHLDVYKRQSRRCPRPAP